MNHTLTYMKGLYAVWKNQIGFWPPSGRHVQTTINPIR